jgi:RNA polymerase subunit RPABC4/transcription elongation factor Spt4
MAFCLEKRLVGHLAKEINLSDDWSGLLVIINPEKSEIGKKIDAKSPGKYAIRVR